VVIPIPDTTAGNYLETDDFTDLRKLIEMINADKYTFDIVYSNDMASIKRFSKNESQIIEGRLLAPTDYGSQVCVINNILAEKYGLAIGNRINIGLCDILHEQHVGLGTVSAGARGRYTTPVKEVELEIVGTYKEFTGSLQQGNTPHWSYSSNTIFVPLSLFTSQPGKFG